MFRILFREQILRSSSKLIESTITKIVFQASKQPCTTPTFKKIIVFIVPVGHLGAGAIEHVFQSSPSARAEEGLPKRDSPGADERVGDCNDLS